jgi:protein-S-isoprenylcysteine O-methyltransferase Ste14
VSALELKVPPDIVALVVAALMWIASAVAPTLAIPVTLHVGIAAVLIAAGIGAIISARVVLSRANTNWKPATPGRTNRLVTTGVYRFTRNPMYFGTLLILLGWAVVLKSPFAMFLPAAYMFYMKRFQIRPEERTLSALFGREYGDYLRHVRRWL